MAIYITGDIHANSERLSSKNFKRQSLEPLMQDDVVFICGDFGLPWGGRRVKEDEYWLNWLQNLKATVAFVDGNHENFNLLNGFPVKEWNGGLVHEVRSNVLHLMRGEVFNVHGIHIFAFGGAMSTDKDHRIENVSWWKQEIYSPMELINAEQNLQNVNYTVDIVLTHTALKCFIKERAEAAGMMQLWQKRMNQDPVSIMLSTKLEARKECQMWYYGHFHDDWASQQQKCRGICTAIDMLGTERG